LENERTAQTAKLSSDVKCSGLGVGGQMGGASGHDLRGVVDWRGGDAGAQRQVGGGHPESVDGVGNVVDGLHDAVGVDVAVSATSDAVPGLGLVLGGGSGVVAVAVLSQLVLSVVLAAGDGHGPLVGGKGRRVIVEGGGHGRGVVDGGGHGDGVGHLGGGVGGQMGDLGGGHFRGVDDGHGGGQGGGGHDVDGNGHLGGGVRGQVGGAGGNYFGGVVDGRRGGAGAQGQVGGGNAEAVDGVRDVVDGLHDAVGVDVAVSSTGDTIPGLHLVFGGGAAGVAVAILAEFVLRVVLAAGHWGRPVLLVRRVDAEQVVWVGGGQRHGSGQDDLKGHKIKFFLV